MTAPRILPANDREAIALAADALRAGDLVAFPTETVYGLGADAGDPRAVAKVYAAKGRPSFNPLISHFADTASAQAHGAFGDAAMRLADAFWPGPLTLVVSRNQASNISDLACAGLETVALRVPKGADAHALLAAFGGPVVAPSANRSGYVSATTAQHVAGDLGEAVAIVLDGGPTGIGIESTIVDCSGERARILRSGAITREQVREVLGELLSDDDAHDGEIAAPGMMASHYAPSVPVRLDARSILAGEAAILFGGTEPSGLENAAHVANLSTSGDLIEAAANLFTVLRDLDAAGARAIAVAPIPQTGLGEAINDRLRRAAAPRDSGS
ncbi:L-threonylcarbamoyladenylate synthase [Tepidamorphus sp. 3E244]|uniref:L-threonylcarbamoyladenylate synthase n=1 Tax=Tepidamorphus sp. 3E244 TaxID=3385498 RepID=UPI0038FBF1B1